MSSAVGCDFSTQAVHFARVGKAAVEQQAVVKLAGKSFDEQVHAVSLALKNIGEADGGETLLIERVFVHPGARQNYDTTLRLAAVGAMIRTLASLRNFRTIEMLASEWRPIAGIPATDRGGLLGRLDLKKLAIRQVKLEFGIDTADDNVAEAILIGRVAFILQKRGQMVAEASL